jgi:23S rRNA (cytidine1920-2'-O)/16S rRNA (cytidine1409-2'-O)-methyltransferase
MATKKRLDHLISERYPNLSKTFIQSLIMQGKVMVEGLQQTKPGTQVNTSAEIHIDLVEPKYVSRAGFKLEKALDHFGIEVKNLVVMDAGISTGGFTDCLLQRGAKRVYGVDVGYGQVHEKIRHDDRVIIMERTNLRQIKTLPEKVDLVTLDLSFISVLKVIDAVKNLLKDAGKLIVLIKPQFEAEKHQVGKGGIVKDPAVHQEVIKKVTEGVQAEGFELIGVIESPIEGTTGNKEFLAYFERKNNA